MAINSIKQKKNKKKEQKEHNLLQKQQLQQEDEVMNNDIDQAYADAAMENGDEMDDSEEVYSKEKVKTYLPGMERHKDEHEVDMEVDQSAYHMLHSLNTEWPCLTFAPLSNAGPSEQTSFPQSGTLVTGTQAADDAQNSIFILSYSNLHRTSKEKNVDSSKGVNDDDSDSEDESSSSSDDDEQEEPLFTCNSIPHHGSVNRLKCYQEGSNTSCATFSSTGIVNVWDINNSKHLLSLPQKTHQTEGYALAYKGPDGGLLSGDCEGKINLSSSGFTLNTIFLGHKGSVEDLQWSPTEASVFASCGTDGHLRLWDSRIQGGTAALSHHLHPGTDINVFSWNALKPNLVATGADDSIFSVWDLRKMNTSITRSDWHKGPITSIEWSPHDSDVLVVSGEDNQISLWDWSIVNDSDSHQQDQLPDGTMIPSNLLFIHQGQRDIKEVHFHPQYQGTIISTSADSFNIFKTISL